ncbi:hypothetical protein, partial [Flavihumibacter solisilvae]
ELFELFEKEVNLMDLKDAYKTAFSEFFQKLTDKTINTLDISNSPLFYYIPGLASKVPEPWWSVLSSNFWHIVLEEFQSQVSAIDVVVISHELLEYFSPKNIAFTSSLASGEIQFLIRNFEAVQDGLSVVVGKNAPNEISSPTFVHRQEGFVERPIDFVFNAENAKKKKVKIMPLDRFAGGVIPVIMHSNTLNPIPVRHKNHWSTEREIVVRGQNKLLLFAHNSCVLESSEMIDPDSEKRLSVNLSTQYFIPGLDIYEVYFWIEGEESEAKYTLSYLNQLGERSTLTIKLTGFWV